MRQREAGVATDLVDLFDHTGDAAALLLDPDGAAARLEAEHHGSTNGRVAGKRQLDLRRENSHRRRVTFRIRFADEYRLAEVELGRDALHLVVKQPVGPEYDGKLIAPQSLPGEHIEQKVIEFLATLLGMRSCGNRLSLASDAALNAPAASALRYWPRRRSGARQGEI